MEIRWCSSAFVRFRWFSSAFARLSGIGFSPPSGPDSVGELRQKGLGDLCQKVCPKSSRNHTILNPPEPDFVGTLREKGVLQNQPKTCNIKPFRARFRM